MAKEISLDTREHIINAYLNQMPINEIAELFNTSSTTIRRIIKRFITSGESTSKPRGGVKSFLLDDSHKNYIKELINNDCSITLKSIQNNLLNDFGVYISLPTIHRTIDAFSFTFKRLSIVPERRNCEHIIEERFQYASEFYSLMNMENGNNMFFLDEVGFNVSMRLRRGRSLIGRRASLTVPALRSRNISICCTMSKQGTFFYKKQAMPYNGDTFLIYIEELINKFHSLNLRNQIIIMDNVRFHHIGAVKEKIIEAGHVVVFLPPYSPFLNPIENMFSQWKQLVRSSNPMNESALMNLIDEKFNLITTEHCSNYFRHMLENIHRSILREIILDN